MVNSNSMIMSEDDDVYSWLSITYQDSSDEAMKVAVVAAHKENIVAVIARCCWGESTSSVPPLKDGQYTHRKMVPVIVCMHVIS